MALDLGLNPDQRDLEALFDPFFEKESPSEVVRRAEPLGFDADLWSRACEIGAPAMAVPDPEHGGGRFSDLVVACECLGRRVAPIPLVEHFVASRLLPAPEILEGSRIATLSLRPATLDGIWRWVPAGAIAETVIGMDGDELVAEGAAATTDRSLHYHGSYGFSLEYDIQLFYRRARGWPLQLGDPGHERQRLADMLWPVDED